MTVTRPAKKGKEYELEVAHDFARHGFPVRRTPNSGGLSIPCDLRGCEGLAIECKRVENLRLWESLDQAQRQAAPTETPLLVFRRNRGSSFVALPLNDFLGLLAEAREIRKVA